MTLDEVLGRLTKLSAADQASLKKMAVEATASQLFIPNPGPQTDCWFSEADETFFGGGAGGGKSSLLCGLAIERHQDSIIFRREFPQIKGLVKECRRILGTGNGYNSQDKTWRLPKGNSLEFGSVPHEDDKEKYQGRPHDLKGFDEITHFSESQYRFLIGWNRPADPSKTVRCRVVATGNPPLRAEGAWVIKYWGPWLDPTHPRPAKPGELRFFIVLNGNDVEVDGPGPHTVEGKQYLARSRTFIPARLEDNPDLMASGYASVIEGMREPLRTMLREGRFDIAQGDQARQVIPTAWIIAAQDRWKPDGWKDFQMTAMALDPAGGGEDAEEIAFRHGGWYGNLITTRGAESADGPATAARVFRHRRHNAPVVVDAGGGYSGAVTLCLKENGIAYLSFNGADGSKERTRDGQKLQFANKRAEAWWRFAEALNPEQEGGSVIALPPDPELRADLAAPTFEVGPRGIVLEKKEDIRDRLGRSPGKGDAVVMCLSAGSAAARRQANNRSRPRETFANVGYASLKRRRA